MANAEQPAPKFVIVDSSDVLESIESKAPVKSSSKDEFAERGIIHPSMKDTRVLNAFRNLRTSLLPKMESYNSCLLVSSVVQGGGASFNAINLAAAFTLDRQRSALLVDCNFRHPSLADALGVDAPYGLYDFVTDQIDDIDRMIYPTIVPRLQLVPCGQIAEEEHVEFFTGERMRAFLHEAKNQDPNRIIILDAPPILDSADTPILSELVDYVLLVLPYRGASASKIDKTIKVMGNDKIIGFVLNN
ncbi:MAG: polysaccharide biosynthesis protein [SAR86 cluster bacterium]|uniref:Polysaccharide biosynthesis protein n=1 Tax=SAR86 cluster bacterium TaxID=2030880 RepID=A0A2A5B8F2_9GAMM|nr:MAG: polysaccharide biosynthesis protein [SAR86 cluster bacterium]